MLGKSVDTASLALIEQPAAVVASKEQPVAVVASAESLVVEAIESDTMMHQTIYTSVEDPVWQLETSPSSPPCKETLRVSYLASSSSFLDTLHDFQWLCAVPLSWQRLRKRQG